MQYLIIFLVEVLLFFFISKKTTKLFYLLIHKVLRRNSWSSYIFSVVFLPGTIIHEMSHLLVALILLVRVGEISLIPEKTDEGLKMGSVKIGKTDPIRRFVVGIAPVFIGIFTIIMGISQLLTRDLIYDWRISLLSIYLLFVITNTMFSSKKDMEGYYKIVIAALIVILVFWIFDVNIPVYKYISDMSDTFKRISIFMLFPIVIDLLIINVLKYPLKLRSK